MPGYRGCTMNLCRRHSRAGTGDAGFGMGAAVGDYDNDGDAICM